MSRSKLSAIEIINKYEYLRKAFKYVLTHNTSNGAPFHNLNPLFVVTKSTYEALVHEGLIRKKEARATLLAAMFHDANHSMGLSSDKKNIEDAKEFVRRFLFVESMHDNVKYHSDMSLIFAILDATEYPYVIPSKELSIYQKIIRDADISQVFQYNWIHQSVYGLSKEFKIEFADFVKMQRAYLNGVVFNTSWGRKMKKSNWPRLLKELKALENCIK
jgi:hypothetical protein